MSDFVQFGIGFFAGLFGLTAGIPIVLGFGQLFGIYTIVRERQCKVFVLFGKVIGSIDEPGFHLLPATLGMRAFIVHFFGSVKSVDLRLDQEYVRSQAVNSEEGAPMGIGIWYEMFVSDPVAYLFRNTDPRGSLSANVSNATVRSLSNLPLERMMTDRHAMSLTVRNDVSPKSQEWGYKLGSIYVRKVHFRDAAMIKQIEEKVVNRLRQVTSAIRQDGANQVNVITSTAERQAAVEFAKARAMRPEIVGLALRDISADPEVCSAMFDLLELQNLSESNADIVLTPAGGGLRSDLLAVAGVPSHPTPPPVAHA
ncbi:MAG: SPFH/Band 7/PHB domain protein [Verrucomicrobia bacterium]|nr:MAG: SPFH/Band 7/PHB domain protein [Verrucomicrobiota bacterium]